MVVSTKGRYAIRAMIDIAENGGGGYVAMKEVAERQALSLKYLERIVPVLVSANLLEGVHGRGGGYRLTKAPSEYTAGEILRLTEGDLAPVACLECDAEKCARAPECRTLPMWKELNRLIAEYLDSVTLADLMKPSCTASE